jgi:hypothetical protein
VTNDRVQEAEDCRLGGYRGLSPSQKPLSDVPGMVKIADYLHKSVFLLDLREHTPSVAALPGSGMAVAGGVI